MKINELYSLGHISPCYELNENNEVINTVTGATKKVTIGTRGYPYVSLNSKDQENRQVKVPVHKIVALARINNGPYTLIEHLNDDKLNYDVSNLAFSNKKNNSLHAIDNGKRLIKSATFQVGDTNDFVVYEGPIKEIANHTNIPKSTLYMHLYSGGTSSDGSLVVEKLEGQSTNERQANA